MREKITRNVENSTLRKHSQQTADFFLIDMVLCPYICSVHNIRSTP